MADRDPLKLRSWEDEDLRRAAQEVRALLDSPGWAVVRRLLDVQHDRLVRLLTNPSLPSYEQMSALSGEIRGLEAVNKVADMVLRVAQEREAENDRRAEAHRG